MTDVLLLRFDAPLMSFGGVRVDQRGPTREFPSRSMVTGLLANALGWDHRQFEALQGLQNRLRLATRRDRTGRRLTDFQTVDLSQEALLAGWTTRHKAEKRGGGSAKTGTHIRYRDYWVDAVYTLAVALREPASPPTLDELERALQEPARPLFLGRKPCLPALPLLLGRTTAPSLLAALAGAPSLGERGDGDDLAAWWPLEEEGDEPRAGRLFPVTDERDWVNQIHVGRRTLREGRIALGGGSDGS